MVSRAFSRMARMCLSLTFKSTCASTPSISSLTRSSLASTPTETHVGPDCLLRPFFLPSFTNIVEEALSEVRTGLSGVAPYLRRKGWPASPKAEEGGREMAQLIQRHPLVTFFLLVYGIAWVVWVPRAAGAPLGVVGQAWTWAPAIAALLAAALTGGRAALRELGARLVRWRVGWQWYLVVILGPAAFSLVVAGVYVLLGGSWAAAAPPSLREGPLVLPLFLVILTLTDGLGEELAWRGFALPRLLTRHN